MKVVAKQCFGPLTADFTALKRFCSESAGELDRLAIEHLTQVSLPHPQEVLKRYPHELSGGMRQRVLIAMAFAPKPSLVIADEPTTALDVTVQKRVLGLLRELQEKSGTAVLFVTHDLGVVAKLCDDVTVMHSGRVVEHGSCEQVINHPQHTYTRALLAATPHFDRPHESLTPIDESVTETLQRELSALNKDKDVADPL
ncbi:MAG: ATP-binding cassette domain-containing protein [Pseudomonadota bacterium]